MFLALVLNESSVKRIKAIHRPLHKNVFLHHITLLFQPNEKELLHFADKINQVFATVITDRVFDSKGDAFLAANNFDPDSEGSFRNPHSHPHLTFSCADGVPPVYSNDLVSMVADNVSVVPLTPIEVTGVLRLLP